MCSSQHPSCINEMSYYQSIYYPVQPTPIYYIPICQPAITINYQNMVDPMARLTYPVGRNIFYPIPDPMLQTNQVGIEMNQNQLVKTNMNDTNDSKNNANQNKTSYLTDDKIMRRKFTPGEDERLRNIVLRNGPKKWQKIALEMPGRTARQCRDRYQNY